MEFKMKKRLISGILAVIFTLLSVLSLASCSKRTAPELDNVKERLVYLIEESKELNVIFFGVGLPVYRRDTAIADRKIVYTNDSLGGYDRLSENSQYITIDAMKSEAEKIYSKEYIAALYEGAFEGVLTGNTGAYLRFYDDGKYLYQNSTLYDFTLNERIYDYSTMKIVEPSSADYINVRVESYSLANGIRIEITLSFTFENGDWYLDSPTY
jgi:hypothetical protein